MELLQVIDAAPGKPWEASRIAKSSVLCVDGGLRVAAAECGLGHIVCGRYLPAHRYGGEGWMFVLQGQAQEDRGTCWFPGDMIHHAAGSVRAYRALDAEPLVFAAVLYGDIAILDD